ncbi:MAG: DUF1365 domain-containing protein [bacterium]
MNVASIYSSTVLHRRNANKAYCFEYSIFSMLLDLDELERIDRLSSLFSVGKFNLLSFYPEDHLPEGYRNPAAWVEDVLKDRELKCDGIKVFLLFMPRILGWQFNPLSIWFCISPEGYPICVLCEVHNTFGERHVYLIESKHEAWPINGSSTKCFHVSPFMKVEGKYSFSISEPADTLTVAIHYFVEEQLKLTAIQRGRLQEFSTSTLLRQFLRVPFQAVKVIVAIHWQALKLWLRGAQIFRKPQPPANEVS